MLQEGGVTTEERVRWAFRSVTSRTPTTREVAALRAAFDEQQAIFAAEPGAIPKLLNIGEAGVDLTLPGAPLAAATMVASALLNHDEAVMRR
jgi:hypothetical protein